MNLASVAPMAMSNAITIAVRELSKLYQIYDRPQDRLKQFLWRGRRHFHRNFWALHPISFTVEKGECIGFIGRNGSGKSTLLQMLAGTLAPTFGSFETHGRVAALLELGAGFNPEFTGRENVILNASLLGLSRAEVEEQFQSIVEFSEIADFIDQPVKTYSTGMFVRLAFATAIHVKPEILIVDEALAVGDSAFQYKCLAKLEELRSSGMSIVFVTHDTGAVKRFCNRAGWLHEGRLVALGDGVEVADQYEDFMRSKMKIVARPDNAPSPVDAPAAASEADTVHARITGFELCDAQGAPAHAFVTGSHLLLKLRYEVLKEAPGGIVLGAAIFRSDDLYVCGINTKLDGFILDSRAGQHELQIIYPRLELLPGAYYFKFGAFDKTVQVRWDFRERLLPFTVSSAYLADGVALLEHQYLQAS